MTTSATPHQESPHLKVALLGAGTVGSQVARVLLAEKDELAMRSGVILDLVGVAVRDVGAKRDVEIPSELLTTDADSVIDAADIVVELTGGIEPARTRILRALNAGTTVVTGNKALIAAHGRELHDAAAASGSQLSYEAAVAGAIPIIRPMRDSLAGDHVTRFLGIMNGTTNFILDQMDTTGAAFDDALAEAQELGYAEADPTADVEGHDAAAKAAVLASLAFHSTFTLDDVHCQGITAVTAEDVATAAEAGYVIKLLSVGERTEDGVNLRVNPVMIPRSHVLGGSTRCVQRRVRRSRERRLAHVLRPGRRGRAHGIGGPGRPRLGRARDRPRCRGNPAERPRQAAGRVHGQREYPHGHHRDRQGPLGCAGTDRPGLRGSRGVDLHHAAERRPQRPGHFGAAPGHPHRAPP